MDVGDERLRRVVGLARSLAGAGATQRRRLLRELELAAELEVAAGELVEALVAEARTAGMSWTAVGRELHRKVTGRPSTKGVTRQAAQARFGPRQR